MIYLTGLNNRQKKFIDLFSSLFNVRNARGEMQPFIPEPFQQEFLAGSMLCNLRRIKENRKIVGNDDNRIKYKYDNYKN